MTELIRQEIDMGNGRTRIRYVPAFQSGESKHAIGLACPMIGGDNLDEPAWGPDGKLHTSKASLRSSYRPSGNPMGNSYIEIGNEKLPDPVPKASSDAEIDKSIHKAIARLGGS